MRFSKLKPSYLSIFDIVASIFLILLSDTRIKKKKKERSKNCVRRYSVHKGISPLVAAVLLIAFTMAVAGLFSSWAPQLLQGIQGGVSEDTRDLAAATDAGLDVSSTSFSSGSGNTSVVFQNTGDEKLSNFTVTARLGDGRFKQKQVDQELSQAEIVTVELNTSEEPEMVRVDSENLPVSDEETVIQSSDGSESGSSEEGDGSGGNSLSLMHTVNYTYDDSRDVQVNQTTAGSDGYQVDLSSNNENFSNNVEEIKIVEMHGADGAGQHNGGSGASGGLIRNMEADATSYDKLKIWTGEGYEDFVSDVEGGWGRSRGGDGENWTETRGSGGGGGSTELVLSDTSSGKESFLASVGGGGGEYGMPAVFDAESYGGGGGAGGGIGGTADNDGHDAEGAGFGGDGGSPDSEAQPGGQEGNSSLVSDFGETCNFATGSCGSSDRGGSSDGSGWILLEYYG